MRLVTQFENLWGVPSFHYHPVFGREVIRAITALKPAAIALEIPAVWAAEFAWGVSQWPSPMVSYADGVFLPIVPGDSMVEAARLATERNIPVFHVDVALAERIRRHSYGLLPDAAFAPRVGVTFLEAIDAVEDAAGPPASGDLAREAHMAAQTANLMGRFDTVMWVGGMAHWSRVRGHLVGRAFEGPKLPLANPPIAFRRMRLESSALYNMTQRLPYQVATFARRPLGYDDARCLRRLALASDGPERHDPIDIASMLVYARNLQALEHLSESPGLWQLLMAASSCLGNEYASRLATLALADHFGRSAEAFPLLTHHVEKDAKGQYLSVYRCDGDILAGEPLFGRPAGRLIYRRVPLKNEIARRKRNTPAKEVESAARDSKGAWRAFPDEEVAYEAFVRYVLEHLSVQEPETAPTRFVSGLGEGIDIRETIRYFHRREIQVREPAHMAARVRNGLIDYTSESEDSWILQRAWDSSAAAPYPDVMSEGGWIDPSLQNVGSASWEVRSPKVLQQEPFHVQQTYRELSFLTLDAPTGLKADDAKSFYTKVIIRFVELPPTRANLYEWLRIMFEFCRNKPFVYYSRYTPGPRVHEIARVFNVRVIHVPLRRIPQALIERHQSFRFMEVTKAQWEELLARIRELKTAWLPDKEDNVLLA